MAPLWPGEPGGSVTTNQSVEVALPLLAVGANDFTVVWPVPFSSAAYVVPKPGVEGGGSVLGNRDANLKVGSRTVSQCVVTVTNSGLVSIAAGAVLHVVGSLTA